MTVKERLNQRQRGAEGREVEVHAQAGRALDEPLILHATGVSIDGCGVAITGPAGSGKSSLALELMAFGAALVADDRVRIAKAGQGLWMSAPSDLPALIEARGIGLLPVKLADSAPLRLIVDLSRNSNERLPNELWQCISGIGIRVLHASTDCPMAAAILQLAKGTTDWTCD